MAEVVTTQLLDPGLVDACGPQPGLTCEWIWEATGNETLAGLVDWLIERPLKVAVILIGAVVVNRLVKRAIDRLVSRLVESRTREEGEAEAESSTRLAQLGRRARGRLEKIHDQAERSRQRARDPGNGASRPGGSCRLRRGSHGGPRRVGAQPGSTDRRCGHRRPSHRLRGPVAGLRLHRRDFHHHRRPVRGG